MTAEELKDIARCGETTTIQFKEQFTGQKEIAKEMIAFANTLGGQIFFGIKDKTCELTEQDIRTGKTFQRNPFMATFATNALHYRGIGSGIVRILAEYPEIEIANDINGKEFKVTIWRKGNLASTQDVPQDVPQNVPQDGTQGDELDKWIEHQVAAYPNITTEELASLVGVTSKTIKRRIAKMPHIIYVGSGYSGHWEVKKKQQ